MDHQEINKLIGEVESFKAGSREQLEAFRIRFLGRKGVLQDLFARMKEIDPSLRRQFGQLVNELKKRAEQKINDAHGDFSGPEPVAATGDLTKPGEPATAGSLHPVTIVRNRILSIFTRIGFSVSEGPEIEDDWHNFSALNFPPDHPARDMQDTFFVSPEGEVKGENRNGQPPFSLRTHTSSVQVRVMETTPPPIRTISPGRVYRNEAVSARAHCFFHQVEGLYIDEDVSFADLRQTLLYFAHEMFGEKTDIRLRPSYFPFTEPSGEMDITCILCGGKGCSVCKQTGWVEILGCGMVHPIVLSNCGIDPGRFSGFAFGMGMERIAMLKFGIKDLRIFSENDIRFLEQFKGIY